ncbi:MULTISPECIES: class C sortase [unclassified Enterococcus]|jgi:sortase A|uniref:class C sortase n=1 Tax=unclassified Enterococcus TaxID=2608891 RepID=UPI003D2D59B4
MTKKTKSRKMRRLLDTLMVLLLVIGAGIFLYPFVQDTLNDFLDQQLITYYQGKANQENHQASEKAKQEMEKKNKELAEKGNNPGMSGFDQAVNQDKKVKKKSVDYYKKHTIAVIRIPKISVDLPVFDETNDFTLQKGAALLEGTSYPVGGKSTHSVISAHRGLPEATLFTDLPKLKVNDQFYIDINDERHAYQIEKIQVIEPTDTQTMVIQPGRDLITLMTCTPYMVNTQRLLVTGHRIPYNAKKMDKKIENSSWWKKHKLLLLIVGGILVLLAAGWAIYRRILAARIASRRIDLRFYAMDEKNQPMTGQVFSLMNARGKKQMRRDGKPIDLTTDQSGLAEIKQLKGGKYWLIPKEMDKQAAVRILLKSPKETHFHFIFRKKFNGQVEIKDDEIYLVYPKIDLEKEKKSH